MSKASKKKATESRAARAQALIEQRRQAEQRRRLLMGAAIVVAVALIAGLVFFLATRDSGDTPRGEQVAPTAAQVEGYGIVLGEQDAPTSIVLYEDLQCPACANMELGAGQAITDALNSGAVKVEYRLISFLDGASTNEYSSRATNAALVVLEEAGPKVFKDYHDQLFAQQPAEGGAGFTDDELIDLAMEVGAEEAAVRPGIEGKIFEDWIDEATEQSRDDDVTGTPTVEIDGERVEGDPVQALLAATGA